MKPFSASAFKDGVLAPSLSQAYANGLLIFIALTGILYFAQDVIIPMFLAALLAVLLSPLVRRIQALIDSKTVAVMSVVTLTFLMLALVGGAVGVAVSNLAGELPQYENNLRTKAENLKSIASTGGAFERAADVISSLNEEMAQKETTQLGGVLIDRGQPILVELHDQDYGSLQPFIDLFSRLVHPVAQVLITFLMLTFMLFNREDLRNRLVRLAGAGDVNRTTTALDDAASRLARLFRTQLVVNTAAGATVGAVLFVLGIPGAILWGIITAIMRFVPYVGTLIASILPIAVALAMGDGWLLGGTVLACIVLIEVAVGHIIEPLAFGKSTGLSPIAIVVAATFWTAIWGPVGLVLSTPLTMMLLVLGKNIERLQFFDVVLGNEEVLSAPTLFYQRMLARDSVEAIEQAEGDGSDSELESFIQEIAVPGLLLAREDERRNILIQ